MKTKQCERCKERTATSWWERKNVCAKCFWFLKFHKRPLTLNNKLKK